MFHIAMLREGSTWTTPFAAEYHHVGQLDPLTLHRVSLSLYQVSPRPP